MTFDEAIEHFRNNTDISGTAVFLDDVEDTLKELREEYAPTIEMTKAQFDQVEYAKKNLTASQLPRVIHNQPEGDWSYLDELSGRLFKHQQGGMTDKNIEDIMRIWLHPETIKIVDE
ncbi:hypothetical protein EFN57_10400 [Leuconostoc citreum]|uniref:hypothetical protein n=1 Tax=Leuconostoc citreum TaxID=33964 RepID=UPI0021A3B7BD|nr:hypothetical protein [Leuconostoc citreum]MCT3054459.1 hypothetical protein [Leuconostoc citreum]MCT3063329.1 hypothetical protein [Leuconostoc citreum]